MKNLLKATVVLLLAAACFSSARAEEGAKKFGIGIILGEPAALDARYWISHDNAMDFNIGWGRSSFWLQGSYLWHNWSLINGTSDLDMPLYYGAGVFVGGGSGSAGFGVLGTIGLDFILKKAPFDFFVELGPEAQIVSSGGLYFHGGIGARFYLPN